MRTSIVSRIGPERYALIHHQQEKIKNEIGFELSLTRKCPYCGATVDVIYRGEHSPSSAKCHECGEIVYFPRIFFRRMPA